MNTSTTGTSTTALALLAAILLTAGGTWWALRAPPDGAGSVGVDPEQWAELRTEVADLREEVELLREQATRLEQNSAADPRGTSLEASAVEASRTADKDFGEGPESAGPESSKEDAKGAAGKSEGWAAVEQMRQLEDPEQRRELAERLLGSEDFWARHGAILEMLQHDPATAAAALHELLAVAPQQPKGEYAAVSAIEALVGVEAYPAQADLHRIYADRGLDAASDSVRLAAARSLETLGDSGPMQREVEGYRRLLNTDELEQRLRGIDLLGRTRSPSAVPSLLPLLDSPDVQIRLRSVQALGRTGTPTEIAVLEAMLDDPVAAVRDQAVEALARLRGERVGK